jgi:hypothetical protein
MSASTPAQILAILGPSCRDNARRQLLLAQSVLNGIDYVEFEMVGAIPTLHVHFLNPVPPGAWGLVADPTPIEIHGGARIVGVTVQSAVISGPRVVDLVVDQQGDFSPYLLAIGWVRADAGNWVYAFPDLDRLFSVAPVNFRPGCPVDFDCKPGEDCPPDTLAEPALDYLARDYASFRQLLIDLVSERSPTWRERSPADLGVTLLELFATEGDHIAYLQDAVANEAYLDTARQRESAKRHARLIDYRMHDGRNARTWVHFGVTGQGVIGKDTQLVTRISAPLRFNRPGPAVPPVEPGRPPEAELNPPSEYQVAPPYLVYDDYDTDPALQPVRVFETTSEITVDERFNAIRIHTWGNERCCLPRGTTSAHLFTVTGPANQHTAIRPPLKAGDLLLLEEVRDPTTGAEADADPAHRQVVEIVRVSPDPPTAPGPVSDQLHDRLYLAALTPDDSLVKVTAPVPIASTLPLLEVTWRAVDALAFPLCLSAVLDDGTAIDSVALARGNVVVADHGRRITDGVEFAPAFSADRARVRLTRGPLTVACPAGSPDCPPEDALPAVDRNEVTVRRAGGGSEAWSIVRDLLDSDDTDAHVVVDVDANGRPTIRFGDAEYGRRLVDAAEVSATYRIGSGRAGNIGAEGIAHVVVPNPKLTWPTAVTKARNPLPASGGVDAETIEEVRQRAPAAFRATQFRAVTEDDYRKAALTAKGVAGAVASFRWTGGWYTAFVGIDPVDQDMILTDARGHTRLAPTFRDSILDVLNRYRLAGYDIEVRSARYVPLDIAIQLCLKAGFFRGDVVEATIEALAGRRRRAEAKAGLFDPANLTFAQPVYLSQIYAAVEVVEGVDSAEVLVFRRHGRLPAGELEQGFIPIGAWEIAQLDNDPSRMENGSLTVTAAGES